MIPEEVRRELNARKIQFSEFAEPTGGNVLTDFVATITADPGDTVLVSRFQTESYEFPCGFDIRIVVVFGRDGKAKERYVHRFMTGP